MASSTQCVKLYTEIANTCRYKQMFDVRLAGDYLYGKWQFTWLSLVMSLMMYYSNQG